jgi:hypothetical protein
MRVLVVGASGGSHDCGVFVWGEGSKVKGQTNPAESCPFSTCSVLSFAYRVYLVQYAFVQW